MGKIGIIEKGIGVFISLAQILKKKQRTNLTNMESKYFKRKWEDTRGDEYDDWGYSTWFIETDINGLPVRQIECYDNGKILKYDINNPFDDYGALGDQELDLEEFKEFEISREEFDNIWSK